MIIVATRPWLEFKTTTLKLRRLGVGSGGSIEHFYNIDGISLVIGSTRHGLAFTIATVELPLWRWFGGPYRKLPNFGGVLLVIAHARHLPTFEIATSKLHL